MTTWRPGRLRLVLSALAAAACAVAAIWSALLATASADDGEGPAGGAGQVREQVARAGGAALELFNTLDHKALEAGLARWEAASIGSLHNDLADMSEESKQLVRDAGAVTRGRLVDVAVAELDVANGVAEVIGVVDVEVREGDAQPVVKRSRFTARMERVGDRWLAAAVTPVAVREG